jgi:pyridinium-3,5-bisthiocarboxylic acid mononucleotide nickel chelatase
VRIKHTSDGGFAPEYDDCRQLAIEKKVPLRTVISEASMCFLKGN